jgi:membrane-associated phospholipid phosphatase
LFTDEKEFKRSCAFLFTGMTIFLIVSTLYPNGHHLRPQVFAHNNIFTQLTAHLYSIDTPTNLFPSIHVFNSIGVHIALCHNQALAKIKWPKIVSFVICTSIVLSTVFLKQHSMFDMLTAFAMAFLLYPLVYKIDFSPAHHGKKVPQKQEL